MTDGKSQKTAHFWGFLAPILVKSENINSRPMPGRFFHRNTYTDQVSWNSETVKGVKGVWLTSWTDEQTDGQTRSFIYLQPQIKIPVWYFFAIGHSVYFYAIVAFKRKTKTAQQFWKKVKKLGILPSTSIFNLEVKISEFLLIRLCV